MTKRYPIRSLYLVGSTEERLSSVHLHQDATQGPHVDGQVVGHSQQHLWGAVEATLDILVYLKRIKRAQAVRAHVCPENLDATFSQGHPCIHSL